MSVLETRKKALLNEYKGNLYEFLVSVEVARALKNEGEFLGHLDVDFQKMLQTQEAFIREFYPGLLVDLPKLARQLSVEILKQFPESPHKIELIGKTAKYDRDNLAEGDLVLSGDHGIVPVSIKLSKAKAFVNTKSGGVKSFLEKYFPYTKNDKLQDQFNLKADILLNALTRDLYELYDLEYDENFTTWSQDGRPSLPGQLRGVEREIYKTFLFNYNTLLYRYVKMAHQLDPDQFVRSLFPLIGQGHQQMIMATTYYKQKNESYIFTDQVVEVVKSIEFLRDSLDFCEMKNAANFEIRLGDRILQLRIKAMNKFTNKTYKVNCSVKHIS